VNEGTALRALVVDDEEAMRKALARFLELRGFEVEEATSGAEALACAQPGRFDLVVMDLWMPGMNGLETLGKFRAVDPWVPVIAVSGMGTEATIEACRAAGATGFLPKPFTAEDIEQMVEEARSGRATQEAVAAGTRSGWRGRILVADDHEAYRTAIARRLRLDGFDVDEAAGGAEAARWAIETSYDALLLDIHMPEGDGLSAAAEVRARDPFLPVIFMSGEASDAEMRSGLTNSTAGCLRKPVEMERLGKILEFLIGTGRSSRRRDARRAEYEALPGAEKAARALQRGARRMWRSPETKRIAIGIVVAVLLALAAFSFLDAGQRAMMEIERTMEGVPGPIDMYRNIVGYLERDEKRELDQANEPR
jgi:DNA-binding NtrC family response regulator